MQNIKRAPADQRVASALLSGVTALVLLQASLPVRAQVPANSAAVSSSSPSAENPLPIRLGAGDLIDVEIFDTPELSSPRLRVSQDGMIKLPLAGDLQVLGLTTLEASAVIEQRMRDAEIMLAPHVTVSILEYATQGIRVLGQVRGPGTYTLLGPHSLYDALSAAGGATAEQGATITITHQSDPAHPQIVEVNSANYSEAQRLTQVSPGDVIVVSRADTVFVEGDVGHSGELMLEHGRLLNVLEAVARAQGLNETAAVGSARIIRTTANGPISIPINLRRIQNNTADNLALQPNDVLIVPRSATRQFIDFVLPYAAGTIIGASVATAIQK